MFNRTFGKILAATILIFATTICAVLADNKTLPGEWSMLQGNTKLSFSLVFSLAKNGKTGKGVLYYKKKHVPFSFVIGEKISFVIASPAAPEIQGRYDIIQEGTILRGDFLRATKPVTDPKYTISGYKVQPKPKPTSTPKP